MSRIDTMRQKLAALNPTQIDIIDESHKHAGHAGAKAGGGHYVLRIVSPEFAGKNTLARQRMVYSALGEMMQHHEIHALTIQAFSPEEMKAKQP